MAASVRIEDEAFSDVRYDVLAKTCQLADADHARGKMAKLWRQCTAQRAYVLPVSLVESVLGGQAVDGLCISGLGEAVAGGIRICGTKGRIEWLAKLKKNAAKGGKVKAAKRQDGGKQEAAKSVPPPFPPSPSPAPSPAQRSQRESPPASVQTGTGNPAAKLTAKILGEHAAAHGELRKSLAADIVPLRNSEATQGWRDLRERIRAFGEDIAGAEVACRHVLAVRRAEAERTRSLRWFGDSVWREDQFTRALAETAPRTAAADRRQHEEPPPYWAPNPILDRLLAEEEAAMGDPDAP